MGVKRNFCRGWDKLSARGLAWGPSIKYVKLFSANFDPLPLLHFVTHHGTPQSTSYISDPPILVGLVQKTGQKPSVQILSHLFAGVFVQGFCQGVFCLEGFVRGGFCPFPLLSEYMYICYNRKLNITLNFIFHMYDKKCISVTSHALDPFHVTNCHTFSYPLIFRA